MYTVIPIFKDPNLHPLHKNNGLSALWCQPESAEDSFFIIQKHPDSDNLWKIINGWMKNLLLHLIKNY